ncbi:MAG: DegV family protein [Lachnospiraceae bacterium]|nr:DegV family protein [Lachnospiraceae bacterium]
MLTLFLDSDMDITPEDVKEYGAKLISMPYSVDEKTIYPYVDFETYDSDAFYDMLRAGKLPTTSAINELEYTEYFEPEFAAGNDVLYVHFSAAMTNTFNFMHLALRKLLEKYPERKFYEIDTKGITTISRNIGLAAADLYKEGKSAEEIVEWGSKEVDHYAMYFMADDLKFFRRSGRVSGLSATMGNLLGIRPIIYMNEEGKMVSVGKEKGRRKALDHLAQVVVDLGENVKEHRIIVGHTGNLQLAEELAEVIREKIGDCEISFQAVNPTAGSHCGPDGVGVTFHAIHR